jgi:hypothetical protein
VCFYHIIKSSFGWKSRFGCTSPILRKIGGASRITITSSSYGLRYYWPWALSFIEGRPRARWWIVEWEILPWWSARARYDLGTPGGTPCARTWLALSISPCRRDGDGTTSDGAQLPGTPTHRIFEKPALMPHAWPRHARAPAWESWLNVK